MSASFLSESSFLMPKGANRAAGAGSFSASIKYIDAWVAASAEEIPFIMVLTGNNSTVSVISSALVL